MMRLKQFNERFIIMDDLKVVVIGGLHHNTLGVIRSLGENGVFKSNIEIIILDDLCPLNNIISSSKYTDKKKIYYVKNSNSIVDLLINHAEEGNKKIVICCSDDSAELVIKNSVALGEYYSIPQANTSISELFDKQKQGEYASKCGLHVPDSIVIKKGESFEWNSFPCITKPIKSVEGGGKSDIRVVSNSSELSKVVQNIDAEIVQIQKYIEKSMEFQLIGCSLNKGENIIIPGYSKIVRQPENTNTGYLNYVPIHLLDFDLDSVKKLIKTIGYNGLFSVEFIRGKDGIDYYLEMNMRNDGNAYCVQSAGVNLPYIYVYYEKYGKFPNVQMSINKDIWFIPDYNDLKVAFKSIGLRKWIKDFVTAESHSIFNKNDIMPFIVETKRMLSKCIKSII